DGLPRQAFRAFQTGKARRIAQDFVGQHGAGRDRQSGRGMGSLSHPDRLFIVAARISCEDLVAGRRLSRQWRQQQQDGEDFAPQRHFRKLPANALRIIAAVWTQPNKAAKEPKRGPWLWPSSTS